MWSNLESRVRENEHDDRQPCPFRREIFAIFKASSLRPGTATKKMAALEFGIGDRLLWELQYPASNFFLAAGWKAQVEQAGFQCDSRPYQQGMKDGGRHSALSRSWSFGEKDCIVLHLNNPTDLRRLIETILSVDQPLVLKDEAITRWIERLVHFFPGFRRFDEPDEKFDAMERNYKLEVGKELSAALDQSETDQDVLNAVHKALVRSNLLPWRAFWPMSPKGDGDRQQLGSALRELVAGARKGAHDHAEALNGFVRAWKLAVPNPQEDPPRQIGEFVLLHLAPDDGVYIRHTVLQDFWLEAVGTKFPNYQSMSETYEAERRFMRAVRQEFERRGLAPRDMIDVQSALWVAHSYTDETADALLAADDDTIDPEGTPMTSTNLILFGPPGTGKTYATALEAVRLCQGVDAAEELQDDRLALMEEYRKLVADGRIEFVTFHQSFSYEDFVEGLRPSIGSDEQDDEPSGTASGGFTLKPHDGVFKLICERARQDRGSGDDSSPHLDRKRAVFKMSLGRRGSEEDRISTAIEQKLIFIGWGGDVDWSDARFDEFEEIRQKWLGSKDASATGYDANIAQTWSFRASMQIDDYVVVSDGRDRFRAFGRVTGDYYFDHDAQYYPHRRKVEWLWKDAEGKDRDVFYAKGFRMRSIYELDRQTIDWDGLEGVVFGQEPIVTPVGAPPFVLIIDEINRANISKVFGELITLLEPDKRLGAVNEVTLRLPYSGKRFGVPANLHIIGTMNTADRSIALLDTALRRRFEFRELMPDPSVLSENLDGINLRKFLAVINERIEYLFDRDHQIGHAYFTGCSNRNDVEAVVRHKVIPLLSEYFYDDWEKVALVLGDQRASAQSHFLEAKRLSPPVEIADGNYGGERFRWSVKAHFDFSEFSA